MALDRIRMLTGDNVNGGGGPDPDPVEIPATAVSYLLAMASSSADPKVILTTPVVADGEDLVFVIDTPSGGAAATTLPTATDIGGAYVEFTLRDLEGNVTTLVPGDIARFWLWLKNATALLPLDAYIAIAVTAGGVASIGNGGTVHGLRGTATGNEAFIQGNAGAGSGWGAVLAAGTIDPLVSGVLSAWLKGNSNASLNRQAIPMDASGIESQVVGVTPAAATQNTFTDSPMTHVAVVVGWSGTGGGTNPQTIPVSLRSFATKLTQIDDWEPDLAPPAAVVTDPPLRIAVIGESNGNGTQIDPTYGGVAVPAGWTFRTAGANAANWPAIAAPSVGPCARLVENAIAAGAVAGTRWLIRRATNGIDTSWPGSINALLANLIADAVTLGGGDPHLVVWVFGANDSFDAPTAAKFIINMRRALRIAIRRWPLAVHCLYKERTAGGVYVELATIQASIDALAAETEFAGRLFVADSTTGTPAALFDDIHFTPAAHAVMADRAFAAVYP